MTKASLLRKQSSLDEGVFECERCKRIMPDSQLIIQDGKWLCRDRHEELWSPLDNERKLAEAQALTDPMTPVERSPRGPCVDAPTITSISPRPLLIKRTAGGGTGTLTIGGVNLSSSDTWDYGHASLTGVVTVTSSTAVSIEITESTPPVGDYNLTYNGQVFRKVIQIR